MASLKEVKGRIATVSNTQKITSAMKMVASAKLHKAQAAISNMLPYEERLHHLLTNLLKSKPDISSSFAIQREVKKLAIIVVSSNSSLCGGFNSNVIRRVTEVLDNYSLMGKENILIYPIGKKVADALVKLGYSIQGDFQELSAKPTFKEASLLSEKLMQMFLKLI